MNVSGRPVLHALRKSAPSPSHMIIIHDSLDHAPLTVSPKLGGSANGHNGVKSVISSVASADFHRLRVGIGRESGVDPAQHVLRNLPPNERAFWHDGQGIDLVLAELEKMAGRLPASSG